MSGDEWRPVSRDDQPIENDDQPVKPSTGDPASAQRPWWEEVSSGSVLPPLPTRGDSDELGDRPLHAETTPATHAGDAPRSDVTAPPFAPPTLTGSDAGRPTTVPYVGAGDDAWPRGATPRAPQPLVLPVIAGLLALGVGAIGWGVISESADRRLPWLGVAVALLIGLVMRAFTRRERGPLDTLLFVGAGLTLVGIVLGRYLGFALEEANGDALGLSGPPVFSSEMLDRFRHDLRHGGVDSGDVAWFAVALITGALALVVRDAHASADGHRSRNPIDRYLGQLTPSTRVAADWIVTVVGAVAIVLVVKAAVVNPYRIPSSSMEPTLHCAQPAGDCEARFSDRVLANRFLYHLRDPQRGEIVVFRTPPAAQANCGPGGDVFVKRLIGLPGETIELRLERGVGVVYINGRKLSEPYITGDRRANEEYGPTKIPQRAYFMMGDNRNKSCDSRSWGVVPRENLIGKVFATYWPPNRLRLH